MFKKVSSQKNYSEMEREVLVFWKKEKVFQKSVASRPADKIYSFYDGPPFITGVPHYGTLLSSIVKDCIPRFWTMKGFRVDRRWGWDCHGLPAENMVEKKLGIKSKKEIETAVGIDKFNQSCFAETSKIADEWENVIDRVGRWVEFKGAYKTMDNSYMESVWWAFSQLYKKDLIYEDVRVSLYCPRCSTPLSNFEIAMDNSYQEDRDPSVYIKLKLEGVENKYLLAWTTTPWTLLGNVALAVNKAVDYVEVQVKNQNQENIKSKPAIFFEVDEIYIVAKDLLKSLDAEYKVLKTFKGAELVGKKYQPLFKNEIEDGYHIIEADFVETEDGTGVVHIAPAFGEDDFNVRKVNDLPIIINVDEEGKFKDGEWKGEQVWDANLKVIGWLKENKLLYRKENITHSYPHCHRCGTKLIYKAQPAWFVNIDKIRQKLIDKNQNVNWYPDYLKEGRFGKGLESAPDWNISRDRYWGTAMPVWKCEDKNCGKVQVIESYEELETFSGKRLDDYHRPEIDKVGFPCSKCGKRMKRVSQVFDCWVESGSMSFAQFHYPFENKEKFEKSFPTNFISEYIGQTRAWFYVMHVMAVGVFGSEAYQNVLTSGIIAGEDGRKMSKSLGNYTDPGIILEKYSADALRFYLLSSPLLNAQNLNFSEEAVGDIQRRFLGTLWNSYSFFVLYANVDKWQPKGIDSEEILVKGSILDKWLLSELNQLVQEVNQGLENYSIIKPAKKIEKFVDNLSNWYIRRSRRRFWKSEGDDDKNMAYQTLWLVLTEFSKVIAPYCPFVADEIFKNLTAKESVHLESFPESNEKLIDFKISQEMVRVRKMIELGLSLRAENGIKVRQPLSELIIEGEKLNIELEKLLAEEVNIKKLSYNDSSEADLVWKEAEGIKIGLNLAINEKLKIEGVMRDLIRQLQQTRKEADFEIDDRINLSYQKHSLFDIFSSIIKDEVLIEKLQEVSEKPVEFDYEKEIKINGEKIKIWLKN